MLLSTTCVQSGESFCYMALKWEGWVHISIFLCLCRWPVIFVLIPLWQIWMSKECALNFVFCSGKLWLRQWKCLGRLSRSRLWKIHVYEWYPCFKKGNMLVSTSWVSVNLSSRWKHWENSTSNLGEIVIALLMNQWRPQAFLESSIQKILPQDPPEKILWRRNGSCITTTPHHTLHCQFSHFWPKNNVVVVLPQSHSL